VRLTRLTPQSGCPRPSGRGSTRLPAHRDGQITRFVSRPEIRLHTRSASVQPHSKGEQSNDPEHLENAGTLRWLLW